MASGSDAGPIRGFERDVGNSHAHPPLCVILSRSGDRAEHMEAKHHRRRQSVPDRAFHPGANLWSFQWRPRPGTEKNRAGRKARPGQDKLNQTSPSTTPATGHQPAQREQARRPGRRHQRARGHLHAAEGKPRRCHRQRRKDRACARVNNTHQPPGGVDPIDRVRRAIGDHRQRPQPGKDVGRPRVDLVDQIRKCPRRPVKVPPLQAAELPARCPRSASIAVVGNVGAAKPGSSTALPPLTV